MIVADSNVLAYLYLPSTFNAQAERLLKSDPEWAVPLLWRSEFRNILAAYMRRNVLTYAQACNVQAAAEEKLAGYEYEVNSAHVLELVRTSDCSAYDCEFVALAEQLGVKLVTMDVKVLKAFARVAVKFDAD